MSEQLDRDALAAAARQLRRLRLTRAKKGGEAKAITVKGALQSGLSVLYTDNAVAYLLAHGVRYYNRALAAKRRNDAPR